MTRARTRMEPTLLRGELNVSVTTRGQHRHVPLTRVDPVKKHVKITRTTMERTKDLNPGASHDLLDVKLIVRQL